MLKSEIEKYLKNDVKASKIKIGRDKKRIIKEDYKKISRDLFNFKSNHYRDTYLSSKLKLGSADRKKVLSIFQTNFDMDTMVDTVLQFDDERSRLVFLKRKGFTPEERKQILNAVKPKEVDDYLKQKDKPSIEKPFTTAGTGSARSLTQQRKKVGSATPDGGEMKFRKDSIKTGSSGFAGGSSSRKAGSVKKTVGGGIKGVKPVGF